MTRGKIIFVLVLVAAFIGWQNLSVFGRETAVLHIPPTARSQNTFVTLWVVEDAQGLWLRAENRQRLWLDLLQDDPKVELTHDGRTNSYRAQVSDDREIQVYVDQLFRAKYGRADQIRGLLLRNSVPIRLERP
jgi:hypothetical protein